MSLAVGTRLGPYEITAPIGAGGPPSLHMTPAELRRGLAEAQRRIR